MTPIFGYLDPGSGSLILQAMVGGFSGIVVLGRYLWTQYVTRKPEQAAMKLSSGELPAQLN